MWFDASQSARIATVHAPADGRRKGLRLMAGDFVLRMRRDLDGALERPRWPDGVVLQTLPVKPEKALLKAAHAVLTPNYWEGGGGAPIFPRWWKALRHDEEFDPALFFLAMDSEGVAGLAQCWTSAFVKDLAVAPRLRRKGLGRALMFAAFEAFTQRGAAHVDLKVREDNVPAIALYKSLGMRTIERIPA